jgi:hypothetical protein
VGSGDFLDETMCSEQGQLTGDGASSALLVLWSGLGFEEQSPQVSIAKSVDGKLPAINGLEQRRVPGGPGVERSETAGVPADRLADLCRQWMVLSKDPIQLVRPIQVPLAIHQPLGLGDLADPGKTVLFFGVVHLAAVHLPAQPLPAVEADLNLEGKPALQAQVQEAKLRVQMVEIEVLALAALQLEFQLFGLAMATQKIGAAGLDASKNPDQALLQTILFNEFPRQSFFAGLAGGQIPKRPSGYFGHAQGGRLDALGQLNGKWLEVFEENSFDLQAGVHRPGTIERGQTAFEPQAVKARKNADDIGLVLGYKFI